MNEPAPRLSTATRISLIIGLFIALIAGLVWFFQFQMNAAMAMRVYASGEGLWGKAQKDAVISLERYIDTRSEDNYQAFQRAIAVPLGDRTSRIELQKPSPDLAVVRAGYLQGGNRPGDIEYAIDFFLHFQHTPQWAQVIEHWIRADQLIVELEKLGESVYAEMTSNQSSLSTIRARLHALGADLDQQEEHFSNALSEASSLAHDEASMATYAVAFLFVAIGVGLSWPVVLRIRNTEHSLAESENRYRSIFEYSNDMIYVINSDGTFRALNPAFEWLTGWKAEDWIGKSFAPLVHADDLPGAQKVFEKALSGEVVPSFRVRLAKSDGQYVGADASVSHLGTNVVIGIVRDVSERLRAEEEIHALNASLEEKIQARTQQLLTAQEELVRKEKLALLGQVAGSVGHELRNPLGVMSNAVYFLQTMLPNAEASIGVYLNIIKDEIAVSEQIVSDLLDAARIKPPRTETVGLAILMEHTRRQCHIPPSVMVKLDIPTVLPPLRVDAMQFHRAFGNLIDNSVEAMPNGGTLEIAATENKPAGMITITVRDTGSGIAPEVMEKLFQPLVTTKARGIGLGLVVVKNLIAANGGTISVASTPGAGTAFTVELPAGER